MIVKKCLKAGNLGKITQWFGSRKLCWYFERINRPSENVGILFGQVGQKYLLNGKAKGLTTLQILCSSLCDFFKCRKCLQFFAILCNVFNIDNYTQIYFNRP